MTVTCEARTRSAPGGPLGTIKENLFWAEFAYNVAALHWRHARLLDIMRGGDSAVVALRRRKQLRLRPSPAVPDRPLSPSPGTGSRRAREQARSRVLTRIARCRYRGVPVAAAGAMF